MPKSEPIAVDWNNAYEDMTVEELQEAILARMEKNGYVNDQMRNDVYNRTHIPSLINWVKSL